MTHDKYDRTAEKAFFVPRGRYVQLAHSEGSLASPRAPSLLFIFSILSLPSSSFLTPRYRHDTIDSTIICSLRANYSTKSNLKDLFVGFVTMKIVSIILFVAVVLPADGFQFMSKWKLPTHDPNREKIEEKFGDKSELNLDLL